MRTWEYYLVGFGMASLCLGTIGLILFFLPILAIPISALGLGLGVIGFIAALWGSGYARRCGLQGIVICALALVVTIAIQRLRKGYLEQPDVPQPWQPAADRPYVPPPAN